MGAAGFSNVCILLYLKECTYIGANNARIDLRNSVILQKENALDLRIETPHRVCGGRHARGWRTVDGERRLAKVASHSMARIQDAVVRWHWRSPAKLFFFGHSWFLEYSVIEWLPSPSHTSNVWALQRPSASWSITRVARQPPATRNLMILCPES